MAFIAFRQIRWPEDAICLLQTSVADVHAWRDHLVASAVAPKTLNRRVASLSSFFKYLQAATAELRLPITVPNPAHAQFLGRDAADPREETRAFSATRARQLIGLPAGDTVIDYRDRAILKFYLYSGARLAAGCRLRVEDFHQDPDGATIRLAEKAPAAAPSASTSPPPRRSRNTSPRPGSPPGRFSGLARTPGAKSWRRRRSTNRQCTTSSSAT